MEKSKSIFIPETGSTNRYLKELSSKSHVKEGTAIWTDFQTAGRGQRGNTWESENGKNLLFSIILYPDFLDVKQQFLISQVVSVAIKNILEQYTDSICIKWPNDIYWKDKKICGILIENNLSADTTISSTIIGAGININQLYFNIEIPNPVSLASITGKEYNREEIFYKIRQEILYLYEKARVNPIQIIQEYKDNLYRKDGYFEYADANTKFYARIKDVELSGQLTLETESGKIKKYGFKEIKFL